MKKAVGLLKLSAAILVAAALLVSCGTEQPAGSEAQGGTESTLTESQPGNEEYIIASEKFGFTLKAPKSWEDRVEISEGEDFSVRHKTISQNAAVQSPPVFTIVEYGSREKWEEDSNKEGEPFPYERLGEIDGLVYAYILPFDMPYDDKTPDDLEEYTRLIEEARDVLKTFKAADGAEY